MGALEASRDTETGQEASRVAPVPGPTAEQGARAAMAEQGARAAMAGLGGAREARTLGGALEAWTLEGAVEERAQEGAVEELALGLGEQRPAGLPYEPWQRKAASISLQTAGLREPRTAA